MQNDDALSPASKYRSSTAGVRNKLELQNTCLSCGSTGVALLVGKFGSNRSCIRCKAEWYVNHCWSCRNHYVDSRDAASPKCTVCCWYRCSHCGACKQSGCSTNPYSAHRRFCDQDPSDFVDVDGFDYQPDRCDWCERFVATTSMPFGEICEDCEDTIGKG